jgi:hypothetical protein
MRSQGGHVPLAELLQVHLQHALVGQGQGPRLVQTLHLDREGREHIKWARQISV